MEKVLAFLAFHKKEGDQIRVVHEFIVEMVRPRTGLYVRVVQTHIAGGDEDNGGLYDLFVVKDGARKPKQSWYENKLTHAWHSITRRDVRERCQKALRE